MSTLSKPTATQVGRLLLEGSNYCGDFEWDFLLDDIAQIMKKKNKRNDYWKATVSNFGWRNQNGCKFFEARDPFKFIISILPNADCNFRIYNYGRGMTIQNFHHDSPTGNEWYYIMPCSDAEFEKNS